MKVYELTQFLEETAPMANQESYDNCGLQVGFPDLEIKGVMTTLDCTEEVVEEAKSKGCNLIVSHHPVIFGGVKKLTGSTYTERTLLLAIKYNIALYAIHTNFDNVATGVNASLAGQLDLKDIRVLDPKQGKLLKLITYVPVAHLETVRTALFEAGAGQIGRYDACSYSSEGVGSFRGGDQTNPFVGKPGKLHFEKESRLELVLPATLKEKVIDALIKTHPYEEVAWDLIRLENPSQEVGSGMIGNLPEPMPALKFLELLKIKLGLKLIRHTLFGSSPIQRVAVCGGAGSFLLKMAIAAGATAFVSSDFKYHEFFDAEGRILIADIGHYESEKHIKSHLKELISKKFPTIAVLLSETETNPVNYYN